MNTKKIKEMNVFVTLYLWVRKITGEKWCTYFNCYIATHGFVCVCVCARSVRISENICIRMCSLKWNEKSDSFLLKCSLLWRVISMWRGLKNELQSLTFIYTISYAIRLESFAIFYDSIVQFQLSLNSSA